MVIVWMLFSMIKGIMVIVHADRHFAARKIIRSTRCVYDQKTSGHDRCLCLALDQYQRRGNHGDMYEQFCYSLFCLLSEGLHDKFVILCLFLCNTDDICGWVLYHIRPRPTASCDTAPNHRYLSVLHEQTGDN